MRELETRIARVWRYLRLQRFLTALVWVLAALLVAASVPILLERLGQLTWPGPVWLPIALAAGLSVLIALLYAFATGPSRLDAAVALDHSFDLDERVSTAWSLPDSIRETPVGAALVQDAVGHVQTLHIGGKFGPRLPRRSWLPLLAAIPAAALLLMPARWLQSVANAASSTATAEEAQRIEKNAREFQEKIARSRAELDKDKQSETDKLLQQIEATVTEMAKTPPATREQALVQVNKLTNALKDRQKALGSAEDVSKQLQQLKDLAGDGPADDFARDLARGEFQKAAEQIKAMREKMTSGQLTEADKEALKEQLQKMAENLKQMANLDQKREMLEAARKNGGLSQQQYEEELAKLNQQAQNLQQLQKLAEQLSQSQQALSQGDMNKAAEALGMSQQQLQELAQQLSELETLEGALEDLADLKAGMSTDDLNQLGEMFPGSNMMGGDRMARSNNNGMNGRGRGQGDRAEAPDDVTAYDTRTPQQYTKGSAVVTGFAPPRGLTPGESVVDIQAESTPAGEGVAEAMTNQRIPGHVKKHVLGYFEKVRVGDNPPPTPTP